MFRPITFAAALAFVSLIPALASAGEFSRRGFYVGVGGSYGANFFEDEIEDAFGGTGVDVDVKNSWGINARAGYRLFSWLAFEAFYEYMNKFETDVTVGPLSGDLDYTTHTVTLNPKIIIPIWRFQPYLLLGVGAQYGIWDDSTGIIAAFSDEKGWAFAGRPGVGVDIYLTKNLVLNAEAAGVLAVQDFNAIGRSVQDLFYISAGGGLQWRF